MVKKIKFYRTKVDSELFKTFLVRSNFKGLAQCLGLLLIYLTTTGLSLFFFLEQAWFKMAAALVIHSLFSSFLGMESTVHELSHTTPFKSKKLNEFFYYLFSFLSWNNPVHFRESHMKHHRYTLFKGFDKEVIVNPAPFGIMDYLSWISFDWKKFLMIMRANFAFVRGKDQPDVFSWDPLFERDNPKRKKMIAFARFQMAGHLFLILLFLYFHLWVLIYTVSFSYFFLTILGRACGITQHIGLRSNTPDFRVSCHTMIFGSFISFFYWNMNYHIEHHSYAAVPFYNLPRLHKAMAHEQGEPVKGFIKGFFWILSLNSKQKKDREWVYLPDLPSTAPCKMEE